MFTIFMDESETYNDNEKFFVMSGIIISENDYLKVDHDLKAIKNLVWNGRSNCETYILHEKEISFASKRVNRHRLSNIETYNHIFTNNDKVTLLYNKLSILFRNNNIYTIGVCLPKNKEQFEFGDVSNLNDQFTIGIQFLIERFCQFLIKNEAKGKICYEAMEENQNARIQQRLYELMALGTMHYTSHTIQEHLCGIEFVEKRANLAGLQLADFVPNTLGRYAAGLRAKNNGFSRTVRRSLYDGQIPDGKTQFGLKILGA